MAKIDDREAYQIHVMAYSDSDSDIDGKKEFDNEYHLLKPPPLDLDEDNIVVISSEDALETNFWEERIRLIQDGEEKESDTENGMTTQPKKKRRRKRKSKSIINKNDLDLEVGGSDEDEDKDKNVLLGETAGGNSMCELLTKESETEVDEIINIFEAKPNEKSTPENSNLRISYDYETLKKIGENVDTFDRIPLKYDGCLKSAPNLQTKGTKVKKKKKQSAEENNFEPLHQLLPDVNEGNGDEEVKKKTNENDLEMEAEVEDCQADVPKTERSTSIAKVPNSVLPAPCADSNKKSSCLTELEYIFGDDFKDFIQSIVHGGTSITDLCSFTYEQLYSAYMAHRQKKARNGATKKEFPVRNAPVQQNGAAWYHPGSTTNQVTVYPSPHQNMTTWHYPMHVNTNTMLRQNNVNWYHFGNAGTNTMFYFYPPLNPSRVNVSGPTVRVASTDTLQLTEIKENEERPPDVASVSNKKSENKKTKDAPKANGAEKIKSGAEIVKIFSPQSSEVTLENHESNKKKKQQKLKAGSTANGVQKISSVAEISVSPQSNDVTLENSGSNMKKKQTKTKTDNAAENVQKIQSEILKVPSQSNGVTLENKEPNKKKQAKQATDELLDGSTVPGASQKECEVKSVKVDKNFFYSKNFDSALGGFMETFQGSEKLITDAMRADKYINIPNFSQCQRDIIHFIKINTNCFFINKRCLELCTLICNETNTNCPVVDVKKKNFASEFHLYGTILKNCIEDVSNCEHKFFDIYKTNYKKLIQYVTMTRAAMFKSSKTCDTIVEEIRKSGWLDTKESAKISTWNGKRHSPHSGNPNEKDKSASNSYELRKADRLADNERLLVGLGDPNPSLKSSEKTDGEESSVKSTNNDFRENLSLRRLITYDYKTEVMYHLRGLDSNVWWCHLILLVLVAYLLIAAVHCAVSFLHGHILHISVAFFIYRFLKHKK